MDLYLPRHGQYVETISMCVGQGVTLKQLPMNLTKLTSLTAQFRHSKNLQLLPCGESQGLLGAAVTPPLKRLRLNECFFKNHTPQGLTAALALLPGLQYLSITGYANFPAVQEMAIRGDVLQQLPQLTYLELQHVWLVSALDGSDGDVSDSTSDDGDSDGDDRYNLGLQHITALTRLADLRLLRPDCGCSILASMLSSAQPLTCLQLQTPSWSEFCFEPGALAGKTLLQHLELRCCYIAGHGPGVVQLLSELQQLQHLTRLVPVWRQLLKHINNPPRDAAGSCSTIRVTDANFWSALLVE
jgi:hypothetical protein